MPFKNTSNKYVFSGKQSQKDVSSYAPENLKKSIPAFSPTPIANRSELYGLAADLGFKEQRIGTFPDVPEALWLLSQTENYAVLKVGNNHYASEVLLANQTDVCVTSVSFENGIVLASNVNKGSNAISSTPQLSSGKSTDPYDSRGLILCAIAYIADHMKDAPYKSSVGTLFPSDTTDIYDYIASTMRDFVTEDPVDENGEAVYNAATLSAGIYMMISSAIESGLMKLSIPSDGNINIMTAKAMKATTGVLVKGTPCILEQRMESASGSVLLGSAKKEFALYAESFNWTEEERALIPNLPDDFEVPAEAMKIARRFVATKDDIRPMKNFMWRGITSFGKSTGVEAIAAMLGMPLVRMTCSTNMETNDFLSSFVPVTSASSIPKISYDDIGFDPEGTYELLTGKTKDDVTPDEVLAVYAEMLRDSGSSGTGFKRVESNFIKGLMRGYLVEVQEASRIKDAGVLVGLNEFDRPNAVIPLVDGSYARRSPNAMVIYTDNVGYNSCRPIDPSVIRRFSFVIDSNELPKQTVMNRLQYNTGCNDDDLMERLYDIWIKIQEYCTKNEISDGSVSVTELEMWLRLVMLDGLSSLKENMKDAVISKATSDPEEQAAIVTAVEAMCF